MSLIIACVIFIKVRLSRCCRSSASIGSGSTAARIICVATKSAVTTATTTWHKVGATSPLVLGTVRTSLASFHADHIDIGQQGSQFFCTSTDVHALVFSLLVDVVEVAQNFDRRQVSTSFIDDTFGAILDNIFK